MTERRGAIAAFALAVAVTTVTFIWNTRVAAGADAYGYVSQADLWLRGELFVDQSFGATVPWPMARWTFTPLGYRPEVDGYRIVPAYAPGLPILMAAARAIAGPCAIFWIVPLTAGVLVLATFAIGVSVAGATVGLGAASIVASSPTVLFMAMAPMSDVPAAAFWAVAVALVLRGGAVGPPLAGLASAVAILIRPNLAPLAGILSLWLVSRRPLLPAVWFTLAASAGVVFIAIVNARLYGAPWRSGYDLTDSFALANVVPNFRRYGWWLLTAETPLAVAGLFWLVWTRRWLLAAFAAAVWIAYVVYVPWDAWWYLRFLLPSWPMMAVGTASFILTLFPRAALVLFAGLASIGVVQAVQRDAFREWAGESKYVEVARAVQSLTSPDDVIISAQHSGTLRYYAGRLTLRWDVGDPAWLDRTIEWLAARGHHPYFVVEEPEIQALRAKAAAVSAAARLDWTPAVSFRGGAVQLFDAVNRDRAHATVVPRGSFAIDGCVTARSVPPLR